MVGILMVKVAYVKQGFIIGKQTQVARLARIIVCSAQARFPVSIVKTHILFNQEVVLNAYQTV
jgi:hypothetical protein